MSCAIIQTKLYPHTKPMIPQGSDGTSQPWPHMNTAAIWVATIAKNSLGLGMVTSRRGLLCESRTTSGARQRRVVGTSSSEVADGGGGEACRPSTAGQSFE